MYTLTGRADLGTGQHVEMPPSSCVGVPRACCCLHGMQSRERLVRTVSDTAQKGGTHSLEGAGTELLVLLYTPPCHCYCHCRWSLSQSVVAVVGRWSVVLVGGHRS